MEDRKYKELFNAIQETFEELLVENRDIGIL